MIDKIEFRGLIKDIVHEEIGDRNRFKIGTIASVDGKPTIRFAGEIQPSEKGYSYLGSYTPVVGDRVLLARVKSTYVILDRIRSD